MDPNTETTGEYNPPRIFEVGLKTNSTVKYVDVVFFADEPQSEESSVELEKDEEMIPIIAAFVHENYPTCNLVGVL